MIPTGLDGERCIVTCDNAIGNPETMDGERVTTSAVVWIDRGY
ncbi:hypothetical protein ACQR1I_09200 [Bradyrhizobium sp. HKCCYLS2038]